MGDEESLKSLGNKGLGGVEDWKLIYVVETWEGELVFNIELWGECGWVVTWWETIEGGVVNNSGVNEDFLRELLAGGGVYNSDLVVYFSSWDVSGSVVLDIYLQAGGRELVESCGTLCNQPRWDSSDVLVGDVCCVSCWVVPRNVCLVQQVKVDLESSAIEDSDVSSWNADQGCWAGSKGLETWVDDLLSLWDSKDIGVACV